MALKDEAFVLRLNEGEASWNAGEDGAHAASHDALKQIDERELFLVERGIF
jgi:hypothetical protein